MMVVDNAQMREADRRTIAGGVSESALVEKAGETLFQKAREHFTSGNALIVCGVGNNGADGLTCARLLKQRNGSRVKVLVLGESKTAENMRCLENYQRLLGEDGEVLSVFPDDTFSLVVDCVYGTGFSPRGGEEEIFQKINSYRKDGAYVLSADIPSGLTDAGETPVGSVVADETLCFAYRKLATVLEDGLDVCGRVSVADVGIYLEKEEKPVAFVVEEDTIKEWLPARKRNTHKGMYGRAAVVGGSKQYSGAAYLAIAACVRGGAGYSSLYVDKELLPAFYLKAPEALLNGCQESFDEADYLPLLKEDAVGFGVGATTGEKTTCVLRFLLKNYEGKLVVDADGLNALSTLKKEEKTALFAAKKCEIIITPHKKEFARLTGKSVGEIKKNALAIAKAYAKENGVVVLLKGCSTIVTDGDKTYISTAGCAGQAKGGSGDVLTGLLTSLLATGLSPLEGAATAAYIAGKSAEIAARERGETGLTATDVVDSLGRVFTDLQR